MMQYNLKQDNPLCRTCLRKDYPTVSAFKVLDAKNSMKLSEMLYDVTTIRITEEDSMLPTKICRLCVMHIKRCYEFKKICLESEQTLLGSLPTIVSVFSIDEIKIEKEEIQIHDDVYNTTSPIGSPNAALIKIENQCKICTLQFANEADLSKHFEVKHPIKTEDTQQTRESNSSQMKNRTHLLRFTCSKCPLKFNRRSLRRQHFISKHLDQMHDENEILACLACNMEFSLRTSYVRHMRRHKTKITKVKDPHLCPNCGKAFTNKANFNAHLRLHSGVKPYVCEICEKAFAQKPSLTSHKLIHTDERKFVCTICGSSYKRKNTLTSHMKKHNGERDHACAVCDKKFFTRSCLQKHLAMHADAKNHQCSYCNKAFNRRKTLVVHLRLHTGERPYSCKICGQSFRQNVVLKTHMKIHEDR